MRLTQRIAADGRLLFRLRSVAPLAMVPLMIVALNHLAHFELKWGEEVEAVWLIFCLLVSGLGLALRCLTVGFVPRGTSGRGTTEPVAAALNRLGMYSVMRNPLYLANGIILLGVALSTATAWFAALVMLAYWLYIERIISAEEAFLADQFGDAYNDWVKETPCFLPKFSRWQAPNLAFSLRTVLRREYPGFMAVALAFTLVEFISDVLMEGEPASRWLVTDRDWVMFFVVTFAIGLSIRTLKKLHFLDVSGR